MMILVWMAAVMMLGAAEETPPGLVTKDSDQDLVAEATHSGSQAQKREAGLSNSYGEPIPADSYGPPKELLNNIPDLPLPAPVYGVPPPGAYGPPAPVAPPSQAYHGPPPPKPKFPPSKIYGPPKPVYGPPKPKPKPIYGPPKKTYGPPKQGPPKLVYGVPFKPPKFVKPKPVYGPPKPIYGPPKPVFGPPIASPPPLPELPQLQVPPVSLDFGLNLPAPIYGTPLVSLPIDLKPNFPVPSDSYGPPSGNLGLSGYHLGLSGGNLGPSGGNFGSNEHLVFENIGNFGNIGDLGNVGDFGNIGQYGPPQPDANPRPPHPGIPAPPTPPHVLYDGWKPIPGLSKQIQGLHISLDQGLPNINQHQFNINFEQSLPNIDQHQFITLEQSLPNVEQHNFINLEQSLPNTDQQQFTEQSLPHTNQQHFNAAQITSGYSNIHHDALANIDLNSIVGGDSNNIDQSKTVFEAHYTENNSQKPIDSYGVPPLESLHNGPYPPSIRQQGAKGLIPPSGIYGVPPGSHYGAPPKYNQNLPIPYGQYSGGGHSGGHTPQKPIKFRDSVPEGLLENVGHITHSKDTLNYEHLTQGIAYLPPPIRDIKDSSGNHGNSGVNSVSLSIEPTNLYSLPHAGSPISFQQPSNLYGSPIDSYSVPLLTVGDHTTSGSSTNSITSTVDGTVLANLSNLEAAAILKHCPYHEAILKAAKYGQKVPLDLASNYVASLSSLGTTLNKGNTISNFDKDLIASHSVVHNVYPENQIKNEKVNYSIQKSKTLDEKYKNKDDRFQLVSDQILQTSERIRSLSEEAKVLQQKIVSSNQNLNVPSNNNVGYAIQIQSSNDQKGKMNSPTIPHDQLLSEGLLQSILQAIEDPATSKRQQATTQNTANKVSISNQNLQNHQSFESYQSIGNQVTYKQNFGHNQAFQPSQIDLGSFRDGLDLPVGYEPVDHTKNSDSKLDSNKDYKPCDLNGAGSVKTEVIVAPPKINNLKSTDDDVAIFFSGKDETVTEISVATSISEGLDFDVKSKS